MVRWSEHRDEYLVRVSPRGGAALLFFISFALAVGAVTITAAGYPNAWIICTLYSLMFAAQGWLLSSLESWIAIPVRGRRAKWGGRSRQTREEEVARFELSRSGEAPPSIVALLVDGRREEVIGTGTFIVPRDSLALVDRLNDLLEANAGAESG